MQYLFCVEYKCLTVAVNGPRDVTVYVYNRVCLRMTSRVNWTSPQAMNFSRNLSCSPGTGLLMLKPWGANAFSWLFLYWDHTCDVAYRFKLARHLLCPPVSHHSVCSVVTAHNLTPVKRGDWNVARVCL